MSLVQDKILLMSNPNILSSGKLFRDVGIAERSSALTSKFVSARNLLVESGHSYCYMASQDGSHTSFGGYEIYMEFPIQC